MRRVRRRRIRCSEIGLRRRVTKVLDDLPARNTRPGFEQDHGCARARELMRDESARNPRSDDDHIGRIRICHLLLSCEGWFLFASVALSIVLSTDCQAARRLDAFRDAFDAFSAFSAFKPPQAVFASSR